MQDIKILKILGIAFLLCVILVVICYIFVDRDVATFMYLHKPTTFKYLFISLTKISVILVTLAPIILIVMVIKHLKSGLQKRWQQILLLLSITLMVAVDLEQMLKFVFGRYWPETWTHNNPAWIYKHAYGFHLFHAGSAYQSFPSGHSTVIFTVMAIVWLTYPKLRWLCIAACAAVITGLLAMDYHFVSDIIAGAFLGAASGICGVSLWRKKF